MPWRGTMLPLCAPCCHERLLCFLVKTCGRTMFLFLPTEHWEPPMPIPKTTNKPAFGEPGKQSFWYSPRRSCASRCEASSKKCRIWHGQYWYVLYNIFLHAAHIEIYSNHFKSTNTAHQFQILYSISFDFDGCLEGFYFESTKAAAWHRPHVLHKWCTILAAFCCPNVLHLLFPNLDSQGHARVSHWGIE